MSVDRRGRASTRPDVEQRAQWFLKDVVPPSVACSGRTPCRAWNVSPCGRGRSSVRQVTGTNGVDVEPWARAAVVVDVANLAHLIAAALRAVGDPRGGEPAVMPDLANLIAVLAHHGVQASSVRVALPMEPVAQLGRRVDRRTRDRAVDRSRRWLEEQQAALGTDLVRPIGGATDGTQEVGVDALCVLEAVAAAWDPQVDAVVVLSNDADLMVAQSLVTDTPVLVAGGFVSRQRRQLRAEGRRFLSLSADAVRAIAPGVAGELTPLPPVVLEPTGQGGRQLVTEEHGQRTVLSSDLDAAIDTAAHRRRLKAVEGAANVVVADPYDLSVSAARALGIAKLPTPETVAELMAMLGFDGPLAQFAAVPDIIDRFLAEADLDELHRQALEQLDDELEALIAAYRQDEDERTLVSTGRLAAERPGAIDPQLRHIEEKKVLTTLAADVLWALHHTDLPVLVLSDRAELAYLLEKLERYVPGAPQRLVRIGLHGRPFTHDDDAPDIGGALDQQVRAQLEALRDQLAATASDEQVVVLNGPCAAVLTGLTRQLHGPALLAAIHREISDEAVEWRMVRFDAVTLGAVLSPVDRPEVEAVFHRMLELDTEVARQLTAGGTVPAGALEVGLLPNPARPCELPSLRPGADPDAAVHDLAVVVEHRDGALHLDVDGDLRPDLAIAVSHGAEAYLPGHTVVTRRSSAPGASPTVLGPVRPHDLDQHPHVVVANGDGTVTDPDTGATAALLELPDVTDVVRAPGSRLLATPTGEAYQALSTTLRHL